jgi:sporulation-control protein spo0M
MKLGGFIGIGTKLVEANFGLDKTRFYPGEEVKLIVDLDNRKCSKDVKSYKIKLWRRWTIFDHQTGKILKQNDHFIKELKDALNCCKRKEQEKHRVIAFNIPDSDML